MSQVKKLRRELGKSYWYRQHVSQRMIRRLQKEIPKYFADMVVSSLTVGCVKIEAVLYQKNEQLLLGYDVFVKDDSQAPEWIIYDSPEEEVILKEAEMLKVLERIVRENHLSYTECCFENLEGKIVPLNKRK